MKTLAIVLSIWVIPMMLHAQDQNGSYNPFVNGGMISPLQLMPVEMNGAGEISFNFGNTGSDPLEFFVGHVIILTITLSDGVPDNANPLDAISGTAKGLFSWAFNGKTFTGTQVSTVNPGFVGTIIIEYKVTKNSVSERSNGFNVNITPAPYQNTSNTPDDDVVSSYTFTEYRDYGDAPDSYGSASHNLDFENYLGSVIDGEDSDLFSASANGDDSDGIDDEDGVVFPAEIVRGETIIVPVTITGIGRLNAWIDWNGNGSFEDPGERVADNVQRTTGVFNLSVNVPIDAVNSAPTFARFRISTEILDISTGPVDGGEVEDYQFSILCSTPTPTLVSDDIDNLLCAGQQVTFTAGGGVSYEFRVGGLRAQNGTSATYTTSTLAEGAIVDVIVTNDAGCSATSTSLTLNVLQLPEAVLTSSETDNQFCNGTPVIFTAAGGTSYDFQVDGTSVQNGSENTYSTSSLINGQIVDVVVTDGHGCRNTSSGIDQIVQPTPELVITNPDPTCQPGTANLTDAAVTWGGTPGLVYSYWTDEGGTVSFDSPTVAPAGTYHIKGTSAAGCADIQPVTVTSYELVDAPSVSNTSLENLCPEETVNLEIYVTSPTPTGGAIFYKTSNNPLGIDVADPSVVGSGGYYIFYQSQEGCFSVGTEVFVTINPCSPDVTPTMTVSPNVMNGSTEFSLIVRITEINVKTTGGPITVNIPKDSRWILTNGFDPSLSVLGVTILDNNLWTYSEDAVNHIFETSSIISAGSSSNFGFVVTFNPGSTRGNYTITAQIGSGGGGEVRVNNNVDSEKIDYFQE